MLKCLFLFMRFLLFGIFSLLLSSCAIIYYPNAHNAPMFSRKGEIQGAATALFGHNLQSALSITNHIGVMANSMSVKDRYAGTHNYSEAGLGYYQNLKTKMKRGSLYADFFGGYGSGNLSVYDDGGPKTLVPHYSYNGTYRKFFVQPGFAFKFDQIGSIKIYVGAIYRVSLVDLTQISGLT